MSDKSWSYDDVYDPSEDHHQPEPRQQRTPPHLMAIRSDGEDTQHAASTAAGTGMVEIPADLQSALKAAMDAEHHYRQQLIGVDAALWRTLGEVAAVLKLVLDPADIRKLTDAAGIKWPNRGNALALALVKYLLFRETHHLRTEQARQTRYAMVVAKLFQENHTGGAAAEAALKAAGGIAGYVARRAAERRTDAGSAASTARTFEAILHRLNDRPAMAQGTAKEPLPAVNGYTIAVIRVDETGKKWEMIGTPEVTEDTLRFVVSKMPGVADFGKARQVVAGTFRRVRDDVEKDGIAAVTATVDSITINVRDSDGISMVTRTAENPGVVLPGEYDLSSEQVKKAIDSILHFEGKPIALPK